MPVAVEALNRMADSEFAADCTVYLHTAEPNEADITANRTSTGGGLFESGLIVPTAEWTDAANGDVFNSNNLDFGTANADVGTVTWYSIVQGARIICWGSLTSTNILNNDPFIVAAGTIGLNGASA